MTRSSVLSQLDCRLVEDGGPQMRWNLGWKRASATVGEA